MITPRPVAAQVRAAIATSVGQSGPGRADHTARGGRLAARLSAARKAGPSV